MPSQSDLGMRNAFSVSALSAVIPTISSLLSMLYASIIKTAFITELSMKGIFLTLDSVRFNLERSICVFLKSYICLRLSLSLHFRIAESKVLRLASINSPYSLCLPHTGLINAVYSSRWKTSSALYQDHTALILFCQRAFLLGNTLIEPIQQKSGSCANEKSEAVH